MTKKWDPEVIIIYVPGTGETHGVCAHRVQDEWRFSSWIVKPESELNPLLHECLEDGMTVIDARVAADLQRPGMSTATPILIIEKGLKPALGVEAMAQLHLAILNASEQEGSR